MIAALLLAAGPDAAAQSQSYQDVRYRLGQSYERSGDLENAAKAYREGLSRDTVNIPLYDALRRVLLLLKQYPEAISLMERWSKRNPKDIGTRAQLGSAHVLNSEEKKGIEIWDKAIAEAQKNENAYRVISSAAMQIRLFDYAISVFKRGRNDLGNENLFTADIARLQASVLNYGEATREYLNLLKADPNQLVYVQSNISTFTDRAEGLNATIGAVENAVSSQPGNVLYRQLLAWLYMEGNMYDRAYEIYKFLDEAKNARGTELYSFSERAARDKSYPIARRALEEIIRIYPKSNIIPLVKFQLGMILEAAAEPGDTIPFFGSLRRSPDTLDMREKYRLSADLYGQIISAAPGTEIGAKALLRLARIQKDIYSSYAEASSSLSLIIKDYGKFALVDAEARLAMASLLLLGDKIDEASEQYVLVAGSKGATPKMREMALMGLARIDYFKMKFKDAAAKLSAIAANSSSDEANDALLLQIFISENQVQSEPGLKEFAGADLAAFRNREPEAIALFRGITERYPSTGIAEQAFQRMGDLYAAGCRYEESVASYDTLISLFKESIFLDRVLMKKGLIEERGLMNKTAAAVTYQRLLSSYPNSIYADEARRRIRELRGDGA